MFRDLGTSRKGAIEIAVAAIEGYVVGPNLKPGWGRGLGLLYDHYVMRPVPGRAASIGNRERELRRKLKRALEDPACGRWLGAMSQATLLALRVVVPARGTAGALIMELADAVGEQTFATDVLLRAAEHAADRARLPRVASKQQIAVRPQTRRVLATQFIPQTARRSGADKHERSKKRAAQ